jgi:hypothetical protein
VVAEHLLSILADIMKSKVKNKITEKWKQKVANRSGILDTGCTSGTGAKKDMDCFHDTGFPSKKVCMLPDKSKIKATKQMQLKHNLCARAGKMNIMPNLHPTLISVPKMADHGYIAVFDKGSLNFMMELRLQSKHWESHSLLHLGAMTLAYRKWNLTWIMKS